MAEKVLLKKYSNRRLYDTEQSAYVTLRQVAEMIRQGRQVEVIDAKTEEDVTAFILTQIILEEAKNKHALLPVSLLHLVIRYGETVLSEFFEKYLQQTLRNYLTYKAAVDEQFRKWLDLGLDFSALAQQTMTGLPPFNPFMEFFKAGAEAKPEDEDGR
ncbi:MAG: polyhydroxyalkanoate synthesis regulator DNA-binding domain-containing protein [Desulfobacca sp.]|nr:polyhydroxyalkanoate synthesis regulator DNA-binding domain-containing protein [Desulfobacca sp.]